MRTYLMYVANAHGKQLSAFTRIQAETFSDARVIYRKACDAKGIDRASTEILAAS